MTRPTDDELSDLLDKQKLQENLFLYCRGIDRMDADLVKSTYWEDSTDDHGGYIGPGWGWPEAGLAYKDRTYNTNHHVSNVLIELDGVQAKRESMFMCVVNWKETKLSFFLGGRYRDLCEKRQGEWKILNRVCIWDWSEHQPTTGGWELGGIPQASNFGGYHPHDPIYRAWDASQPTPFPRPSNEHGVSNIAKGS